ncbi:hypothetical protein HY357_00730, partial [Candidatus Roizmanbacteria bacterium]|nr:hypothetical protein [Candidatus Roizmanbacteria bacterium]
MIKKNHKMWWLRKNLRRRLDSSTVLAIFTLVVMLVSIPISLQFLGRIKEIDRTNITYAEGQNSSLTISASNIVDLTSPFDAIILLNTDSAPIRAVDVVIDYDPTYLD